MSINGHIISLYFDASINKLAKKLVNGKKPSIILSSGIIIKLILCTNEVVKLIQGD